MGVHVDALALGLLQPRGNDNIKEAGSKGGMGVQQLHAAHIVALTAGAGCVTGLSTTLTAGHTLHTHTKSHSPHSQQVQVVHVVAGDEDGLARHREQGHLGGDGVAEPAGVEECGGRLEGNAGEGHVAGWWG